MVEPGTAAPHQEYARRLQDRRAHQDRFAGYERILGNGRVLVFLAGLALAYLAFGPPELLSAWWLLIPLSIFSVLLVWHERVTRNLLRASRSVAFYERGLARLENRWRGTGQPGLRFQDEKHPYAADLELFGPGSLFELLCTARTRTGEDTLAAWLKGPARPDEVRARQTAVAELRPLLDLREDLALLGSDIPIGVDFDALARWGADPPILVAPLLRLAALVLAILGLVTLIGWLAWDIGPSPLLAVLLLEGGLALLLRDRVARVVGTVEKRGRDLALLAGVLARLERESFTCPRLRDLRAALDTTGTVPSQRIAQLSNLIDLLNSRRNMLFAPFALLTMWTTQMAHAVERWRLRTGPAIRGWLETVGQFEALCSLAAYAYENPADTFPEIVEGDALFDGAALGHPLLPGCIRNDLSLGGNLRVLIVSGSNMSGKSTMLRTVGVNIVLALAGSPVRATRLRLSPLMVGATLRIQDSLQEGRSRFYTELLRVRQVVELSGKEPPLFFLLDEIFHGTNSHDRRIGAEAVVRGLVERGAIGLVTTHDLTLTHITETLASRSENVHFADHLEDGRMVFDYKMQPGVVQHSNALALMRAVGLEV
jgi:MutS domain V